MELLAPLSSLLDRRGWGAGRNGLGSRTFKAGGWCPALGNAGADLSMPALRSAAGTGGWLSLAQRRHRWWRLCHRPRVPSVGARPAVCAYGYRRRVSLGSRAAPLDAAARLDGRG